WRRGRDSTLGAFYHHGGTSNGGSAFVFVLPSRQLVIAMATTSLAHLSDLDAMELAERILRYRERHGHRGVRGQATGRSLRGAASPGGRRVRAARWARHTLACECRRGAGGPR